MSFVSACCMRKLFIDTHGSFYVDMCALVIANVHICKYLREYVLVSSGFEECSYATVLA